MSIFIINNYVFIGDNKEIQEAMNHRYETDPAYKKMMDGIYGEIKFQNGLNMVKRFTKKVLGLEDKL